MCIVQLALLTPARDAAVGIANAVEDQHPAALQYKIAARSPHGQQDPAAKGDQCDSDYRLKVGIRGLRQQCAKPDGGESEHDDDCRMAEGVEGAHRERSSFAFVGTCDIADCCDVIPVDAVADAQSNSGADQQQPKFSSQRDSDQGRSLSPALAQA